MTEVSRLGHVHLKVRELDRCIEFYQEVLGLEVTERVGRYAFLSLGDAHHDLALQGLHNDTDDGRTAPSTGTTERTQPSGQPGLYHAAWAVDDADALRRAYERLTARGVAVTPVDHGISKALYFDDPDGNGVEIYLDMRAERDLETWEGRNERFDPSDL